MSGCSGYRPGLQTGQEPVVSAHFMHAQNMNPDYRLYDEAEFEQASLVLPLTCLKSELIPLLRQRSRDVAEARSRAAIIRAAKGGEGAESVRAIAELVLDRWFRKGPRHHISFPHVCTQIERALQTGQPVRLVAPLLPFKKDCPLKTRGVRACMAEIDLLCRLSEMTEAIALLRQHYHCSAIGSVQAEFLILGDGHRFSEALNAPSRQIETYQAEIVGWIEEMGLAATVRTDDYENLLARCMTTAQKETRLHLKAEALKLYQNRLNPVFNPANMEETLRRATQQDPLPDTGHPEGRFVPLFKSILYTCQYHFLHDYCQRHTVDFATLYREVLRDVFTVCDDLSPVRYQQVYDFVHGVSSERPADTDTIIYLRRQVLHAAWKATIAYLAVVKMDRDLFEDPVAALLPDYIRFTIHAKPGQIGLRTTASTQSATVVQPWHGVSLLRPDGEGRLKFDTTSRLMAESLRARPVVLCDRECSLCESACPFDSLIATRQPFFYLHPAIEAEDYSVLLRRLQKELTRRVS